MDIVVFSVTPSPYQRDFFAALAARPGLKLQVNYLEQATPDSPWPMAGLGPYEKVLPGKVWGNGRVRSHWNRLGNEFRKAGAVVVNTTVTALTTQRLFHGALRGIPWYFWGEILRIDGPAWKNLLRDRLASPLRHAAGIFAVGSKAAADYERRFPGVPVWNMPYRCRLEAFGRNADRGGTDEHQGLTFLYCGQMIARKGVDVLLEAFAGVVREGHDVRLLLSGREADLPGWLARLDEHVRGRIEYTGFTAPQELPGLYARADVFVMPSRHDGWGVVVNQAIGAGLPIIASTAVGAAHDLVKHGANGVLVEPGDAVSLMQAMRWLAADGAARNRMASQSHDFRTWLEPATGAREMVEAIETTRARGN